MEINVDLIKSLRSTQFQIDEVASHFNNCKDQSILNFAIHFYITCIDNINDLFRHLEININVDPVNLELINQTNLVNVVPLFQGLDLSTQQQLKSEFHRWDIQLDVNYIQLGINSTGKLDPFIVSYFCMQLSEKFQVELKPFIFTITQNKQNINEMIKIYANKLKKIYDSQLEYDFNKQQYDYYLSNLIYIQSPQKQQNLDKIQQLLLQLQKDVQDHVIQNDLQQKDLIEQLLIGMMGMDIIEIRDQAIKLLNILYDKIDWQLNNAYKPKIACIGDVFRITYLIESQNYQENIMVVLNAPCFDFSQEYIQTWHKPQIQKFIRGNQNTDFDIIEIKLQNFKKCGYYDWKLVRLDENGNIASVPKICELQDIENQNQQLNIKQVQGRIIVQPQFSRQIQVHEVFVDQQAAQTDSDGLINQRGNFSKVRENIQRYSEYGINCLYLMGGLERDNQKTQQGYCKPDASPFAIVDRQQVSNMLGGDFEFKKLISKAKQYQMKIILDSLSKVSSSRPNRVYKDKFIYTLDEFGKQVIFYGSDGKSLIFEDTALLNYRRKDVWDLLLQETITLIQNYDIDGIHLDNCQAWPNILKLDLEEMYRKECRKPAYTDQEIFEGHIVISDEDSGYWTSNTKEKYPNPLLVKLCKGIWKVKSDFVIIAEAWNSSRGQYREINIIKSGPIPRVYFMPIYLASIFGKKLSITGNIKEIERQNVNVFKNWCENIEKIRPKGSIVIQSTTAHCWPYPALLYKRGVWPAVDVFFFLKDPPMTFIGEHDGHSYRTKTINVMQKINNVPQKPQRKMPSISSYGHLGEVMDNQYIKMNLNKKSSMLKIQKFDSLMYDEEDNFTDQQPKGKLSRVLNFQKVLENFEMISIMEDQVQKELNHQYGFDISQIKKHYQHRRLLRSKYNVLTQGQMVLVNAEDELNPMEFVMSFARYNTNQIMVIAANFNNYQVDCYLNLKSLKYIFTNFQNSKLVFQKINVLSPQINKEYMNCQEMINRKHQVVIKPYESVILLFELVNVPEEIILQNSYENLLNNIKQKQTIQSNMITNQIINVIRESFSIEQFIDKFSEIWDKNLKQLNVDWVKGICLMKEMKEHSELSSKFLAMLKILQQKYENQQIQKYDFFDQLFPFINYNKLNHICFLTPEIGKWSTIGGLGVMIDELSQGLAAFNENIIVISPYYHRNKKGETDYLKKDNINHIMNFKIQCGNEQMEFGVFYGVVNDVNLYFLHNELIFPSAYPDGDAYFTMRQLAAFGKASLELICKIQKIPQLIVTNDWFTGLVAAYAKNKDFGSIFENTQFFHIVHNLDETYEGRIFPPNNDNLWNIHRLPCEWLIDPYWKHLVINPSRCALWCSDQWGTVSMSYRQELLEISPLQNLLKRFKLPFAFPNGIRKEQRLQNLIKVCNNDHFKAKETIQQKYFNSEFNDNKCLMSFVGRITEQKGVKLILEAMYYLLENYKDKIQVIVGGQANMQDPYGAECFRMIIELKNKYPKNFWASPTEFFYDGNLLNCGSDFALMPSKFEPGGIVQHEYFVGSTPVIAHKTGGLKDTVIEYDIKKKKGSGIVFDQHTNIELRKSIEKAIKIFQDKTNYNQIRQNAFEAVIDVVDVAKAWDKEFYQINGKLFIDENQVQFWTNTLQQTKQTQQFDSINMNYSKHDRIINQQDVELQNFQKILIHKNRILMTTKLFMIKIDKVPRPKVVYLIGSFDQWKNRHKLNFDYISQKWTISLQLQPGYKYFVTNEWVLDENEPQQTDHEGNINNMIVIN